jgi:glycosyltransferase involved in cell wall biosynthesis
MNERVALLINMPAPYRLPFFRDLSRYCDLLVIFDDYLEPNREWIISERELGFQYTFAKGFRLPYQRKRYDLSADDKRYLQIRYDILPTLYTFKPHVVVSAEMGLRTLQAAGYSKVTSTPLIIWWEGTRHTEGWVGKGKSFIRESLVKGAQRFWSNGRESTALLLDYGALPGTIDDGITGVDTKFFALKTKSLLSQRVQMRSELELEGVVFLFIGQFTKRKGLLNYLKALEILYSKSLRGWSAVFVGNGPLETILRNWQLEHPDIPMLISSFVQPHELPRFYASADVFVLPTLDDNWSLVTLEAAVAGLPQLFSVYNGCTSELLCDERMGRAIDPLKTEEFASALKNYVDEPPPRLPDGLIWRFVDYYHPEQLAARAWESIRKAVE